MQKPDFLKGRKGITFVDLFAGAGGFSEGFMQAYTDKNYYDFSDFICTFLYKSNIPSMREISKSGHGITGAYGKPATLMEGG